MSDLQPTPKFDVSTLRLPQNFGETLGVKKLITHIPVSKPGAERFFRANPSVSMQFESLIYEDKSSRDVYVVLPALGDVLGRLAKPVVLYLAVDRRGNPFLIPVPLPGPNGSRYPWHESLAMAVEKSKTDWVRIAANMTAGVYDLFVASAELPLPEWPDMEMDAIVQIAFGGKIIDTIQHPVIQALQGKV